MGCAPGESPWCRRSVRQWVKNILVGAAPLAAGELFDADVATATALAFVTFCAASSSVYLINDVVDAPRDRQHPQKALPTQTGSASLSPRPALAVASLLAAAALAAPLVLDAPKLTITLATYLALSAAYNFGLKHQRVSTSPLSPSGSCSVRSPAARRPNSSVPLVPHRCRLRVPFRSCRQALLGVGDPRSSCRRDEAVAAGLLGELPALRMEHRGSRHDHRLLLVGFRGRGPPGRGSMGALSVAPFVVAMLRFALDVDQGRTGAPEEVALHDRVLVCVSWSRSPCSPWEPSVSDRGSPGTAALRLLHGWGRAAATVATVVPVGSSSGLRSGCSCRRPGDLARGLGRSYGDAAQNAGGTVLDLTRLVGPVIVDEAEGTATCSAGTSLDEVMRDLLPRGWFVPVTPGTRQVTVGGAVAADVHGKNHHTDGSIGAHVRSVRLVTGTGEVRDLQPGDALLDATLGGMGLTGVVTSATIGIRPVASSWMSVDTTRADNLDALMDALQIADSRSRYSVAWIDCMAGGRHLGRAS